MDSTALDLHNTRKVIEAPTAGRLEVSDFSHTIYYRDVVDSALDTGHALGLAPWESVVVSAQRSGRGQMRRNWYSPPGNVYASLGMPADAHFQGTVAAPVVGAMITKSLRRLGLPASMKWPNDIVLFVDNIPHKVGGILLEDRGGVLLAGIGINFEQAPRPSELREGHALHATCICERFPMLHNLVLSEKPACCTVSEALWCWLVRDMYFCYHNEFLTHESWRAFVASCMLWLGEEVCLTEQDKQVCGMVTGVGPCGGICLLHHGVNEEFLSGSIFHVAQTTSP